MLIIWNLPALCLLCRKGPYICDVHERKMTKYRPQLPSPHSSKTWKSPPYFVDVRHPHCDIFHLPSPTPLSTSNQNLFCLSYILVNFFINDTHREKLCFLLNSFNTRIYLYWNSSFWPFSYVFFFFFNQLSSIQIFEQCDLSNSHIN